MGYSASTPMRSATARKKMMAFMGQHYQAWNTLQPQLTPDDDLLVMGAGPVSVNHDWTAFLEEGEGLYYGSKKNKIGFNFSDSQGILGYYGFSILRWMALHGGALRKVSKAEHGNLGRAVPVMCYDDAPAWPVLVSSEWDGIAPDQCWWCLVDEYGYKRMARPWFHPDSRNGTRKTISKIQIPALTNEQRIALDAWVVKRFQLDPGSVEPEDDGKYVFTGGTRFLYYTRDYLVREGIYHTTEKDYDINDDYAQKLSEKGGPRLKQFEQIVRNELMRLSQLWDEQEKS